MRKTGQEASTLEIYLLKSTNGDGFCISWKGNKEVQGEAWERGDNLNQFQQLKNEVCQKLIRLGFDSVDVTPLGDAELFEAAVAAARDRGKGEQEIAYMLNMALGKLTTKAGK